MKRDSRLTYLVMGALLGVMSLASAACGTAVPAVRGRPAATGSWAFPNGNLANTRDALDSTISSANVSQLRQAWSFKLRGTAAAGEDGYGALTSAPIVANGLVYFQDLDSNVYAVALTTGRLQWEHRLNSPEKSGPGPNGVAVASGVVYGDSPTTVFALNASTGRAIWVDRHLLRKGQGSFEIQPQVADGKVFLASAYGLGPGGGVLIALQASNGRRLWTFDTVVGEDAGVRATGAGSGGAWQTPLVGTDGSVTFGIGNPYQSAAAAIQHPARQLYTDSDVNLNASTGKLNWYYQGVPDDFEDHDMQASPMAADIDGAPVVLGGGKLGSVYAMNAATGGLIWQAAVGVHNGNANAPAQALDHRSTVKVPFTFLPGALGGVLTNMAVAGNSVYVATVDLAFTLINLNYADDWKLGGPASGEMEALNLTTGKVEWDTHLDGMPLGAATVSNDLVFTTLYRGTLVALNRRTGAVVYRQKLPAATNAPIAIAGNTVLVPAGGPKVLGGTGGQAQLVAYSLP